MLHADEFDLIYLKSYCRREYVNLCREMKAWLLSYRKLKVATFSAFPDRTGRLMCHSQDDAGLVSLVICLHFVVRRFPVNSETAMALILRLPASQETPIMYDQLHNLHKLQ
jgi:hypothetical protein